MSTAPTPAAGECEEGGGGQEEALVGGKAMKKIEIYEPSHLTALDAPLYGG